MDQLQDVIAAAPHLHEPLLGDGAQLDGLSIQPTLDCPIVRRALREPKNLHAVNQTADIERDTAASRHAAMIQPLAVG
jgi:hypothetical protein